MNPQITLRIIKNSQGRYTLGYIVKCQGKILYTKKERFDFMHKKDAIFFGKHTIDEANQIGFLPV
ncbi:MAG: hypothetical protein ACK54Y_02120 [Bacteroidota bacterium]|jgi:hypothetical protein